MTAFDRIVSLAGRSLHITASSEFALSSVAPAFEHLPAIAGPSGNETALKINEENPEWRPTGFAERGVYHIRNKGFASVQDDPPMLESYSSSEGMELHAGRSALQAGDFRAHPASFSISVWLEGRGRQVLHAGGVAYDGKAALILGPGGVGKSTTVLACAMRGADYLGDDLVYVDAAGRDVRAYCLYGSAKLNQDSAARIGTAGWPVLGITPKNKTVFAVQHTLSVPTSARLVALIALGPAVEGSLHPQRLGISEAVACLSPTAAPITCRAGAPGDWLATIAALAQRVPAYRMPVSWNFDELSATVQAIVSTSAEIVG